jgi:hypothetical protein
VVGDVVRVRGPPIVIHPDFAGAAVEPEFDGSLLALEGRDADTSQLGQRVDVFRFRALRSGTSEVALRLTASPKRAERTTTYAITIHE